MDRPKLIGDIVTHWHKFGERRKTVAFAVNVAHSLHLRDEFVAVRRSRRTYRRLDAEARARRNAGAAGIRRDRACHQLHGADRRLGHAGGRLLHPGAADPQDGALSADDRPRAAARRRQARRHRARSFAALCFGMASSRITSNGRSIPIAAPTVADAPTARNARRLAPASNARNAALSASPAKPVRIADSCRSARRARRISSTAISVWSMAQPQGHTPISPIRRCARAGTPCWPWIADERGYKPGWVAHKYKEKFGTWPPWGARAAADPADARGPQSGCARA